MASQPRRPRLFETSPAESLIAWRRVRSWPCLVAFGLAIIGLVLVPPVLFALLLAAGSTAAALLIQRRAGPRAAVPERPVSAPSASPHADFASEFARLASSARNGGTSAGIALVSLADSAPADQLNGIERALLRIARPGEIVARLSARRLALSLALCSDPRNEHGRIERAIVSRLAWPGNADDLPLTDVTPYDGPGGNDARDFALSVAGETPAEVELPALRAVDPRSIRRQLVTVREPGRLRRAG